MASNRPQLLLAKDSAKPTSPQHQMQTDVQGSNALRSRTLSSGGTSQQEMMTCHRQEVHHGFGALAYGESRAQVLLMELHNL